MEKIEIIQSLLYANAILSGFIISREETFNQGSLWQNIFYTLIALTGIGYIVVVLVLILIEKALDILTKLQIRTFIGYVFNRKQYKITPDKQYIALAISRDYIQVLKRHKKSLYDRAKEYACELILKYNNIDLPFRAVLNGNEVTIQLCYLQIHKTHLLERIDYLGYLEYLNSSREYDSEFLDLPIIIVDKQDGYQHSIYLDICGVMSEKIRRGYNDSINVEFPIDSNLNYQKIFDRSDWFKYINPLDINQLREFSRERLLEWYFGYETWLKSKKPSKCLPKIFA